MLSRNASPSDLLDSGALNNLRRVTIGNNVFRVAHTNLVHIPFQQATRLYGIKVLNVAGDGFNTQVSVSKNAVSIVKSAGITAGAVAMALNDALSLSFLDANTDGYVDFANGDILLIALSNSANNVATDHICIDLDLVQG